MHKFSTGSVVHWARGQSQTMVPRCQPASSGLLPPMLPLGFPNSPSGRFGSRSKFVLSWFLAGSGFIAACSAQVWGPLSPEPSPLLAAPAAEDARGIAEMVNLYRASLSLTPLVCHPVIAEVAQGHAEAMAVGTAPYSHAGLADRPGRIAVRVRTQAVDESLAGIPRGTVSPLNRAVERWIASDAHRHTMEGCFELTGVGMARSPGGVLYLRQIFVLRTPGQPTEARRGSDLEMAGCR